MSFKEAIAQENERLSKSLWYGYRARSAYVEQVERYLDYFPKSNMFFMFFEDLVNQTEPEVDSALDFLNVQKISYPLEREGKI